VARGKAVLRGPHPSAMLPVCTHARAHKAKHKHEHKHGREYEHEHKHDREYEHKRKPKHDHVYEHKHEHEQKHEHKSMTMSTSTGPACPPHAPPAARGTRVARPALVPQRPPRLAGWRCTCGGGRAAGQRHLRGQSFWVICGSYWAA